MELIAFYILILMVWGIYTYYVFNSLTKETLNEGVRKFLNGQFYDALSILTAVIENDRNNADAYFYRGEIFRSMENYQDALGEYDKTIKLNNKFSKAYIKRGITRGLLKDSHGAIDDFNNALKLEPDNAAALTGRGSARYMIREYENALADFNKAIELDKNYKTAYLCRSVLINKLNHPEHLPAGLRKSAVKNLN